MVDIGDGALVWTIESLYHSGASAGLTDAQLLDRITSGPNEVSRIAFEAIVARHGGTVIRVCRQAFDNPHDVQDAFQATFLVLARRAGSIRSGDSLTSWLFGVARRVCARAKVDASRRRIHERQAAERMAQAGPVDSSRDHAAIHEEIAKLPERYRLPVILCYLEGLTYEVAAERLQWPLGTLSVRLSRARVLLRSRLSRRGLTATAGLLAFTSPASAGVSTGLATESTRLALRFMDFRAAGGGTVPSNVVHLARGVLKAMQTTSKMKTVVLGLGMVVVAGLGGLAWSDMVDGERPRDQATPKPTSKAASPLAGDLARLQGVWIKIDPDRDDNKLDSLKWEIEGTWMIIRGTSVEDRESEHRSEIRLDEQVVPHRIDFVQKATPKFPPVVKREEQELVERLIYKIEGDSLTVCYREGFNQPRPNEFPGAGGDDSLKVSTFRRGKPRGSLALPKSSGVAPKGNLAHLQGTWVTGPFGPDRDMTATVKVEGDVMTLTTAEPSGTSRLVSTVTLHDDALPRSLDLATVGPKPARVLGIYRLDGDTLTLHLGPPDGSRPTEFTAEGPDPFSLLSLKRRKL